MRYFTDQRSGKISSGMIRKAQSVFGHLNFFTLAPARNPFALRAGYAFLNTPVPDHTFEPGNPDADQHHVSIGLGYRVAGWRIDGFYDFGVYQNRRVQNAMVDGKFSNAIHYLGVSAGWTF